ncbi:ripening-induced polygalacturonase, partial [Genlisea aurea]
ADVVVDVDDYGAVPDGVTESSAGFHGAWAAACGSSSGTATVYAKGDYLVDGLVFSGPCNCSAIRVVIDGSVVAPADYTDLENSGYWILVENVAGVFFSGGVIDGNGSEYWACKNAGDCNPDGAR